MTDPKEPKHLTRILAEPAPDSMDYLGVKSCGCAVAWTSGTNPAKDLAKDVAAMIRSGLNVERVSTEESRKRLRGCKCEAAE